MFNPYVILGLVLAWGASIGGAYFYGQSIGKAVCEAVEAREQKLVEKVTKAAQTATAEEIAKLEVKNVTITQRVETKIREVPVYRDCVHAPGVLDDINEARTGRRPADKGKLPGTK